MPDQEMKKALAELIIASVEALPFMRYCPEQFALTAAVLEVNRLLAAANKG